MATTTQKKHATIVKSENKKRRWNNADTRILHERLDMMFEEAERSMLRAINNDMLNKKYVNHAIKNYQRISKAVGLLKAAKKLSDNSEYNAFVKNGGTY